MNNESNRCVIAFASNEKGALMLGIALYSLLKFKEDTTHYVIYILDDLLSASSKHRMLDLVSSFDCEIYFIPVSDRMVAHRSHQAPQNVPPTTYARIYLPSLLIHEKRVLYIDIDVLILDDLSPLFKLPLKSEIWARAVFENQGSIQTALKKTLDIPMGKPYFNAGVILMELSCLRINHFEERCIDFINCYKDKLSYGDQDVLNGVLFDNVAGLHPRWNWAAFHTRRQILYNATTWGHRGKKCAREAAIFPAIIHFCGGYKPVHYNYHYARNLYRTIWRESPWGSISYTGGGYLKFALLRLRNSPLDLLITLKARLLKILGIIRKPTH